MNKKICILMATVLSLLYLNSCSLFHTHLYKDVKVVEPTCTEKGYTLHTCKCGDSYKSDETNKLGHDAEWVVTDQPSCTKSGRKEYRCKRCNVCLEYKIISGHNYVDNKCTLCGKIEADHIYVKLPTLPLTVSDGYTTSIVMSVEKRMIRYGKYGYDGSELTFTVKKAWDKTSGSYSRACRIGYKLYDSNNMVVRSGTISTEAICVGEMSTAKLTISDSTIPEGQECRLVLLDVD